MSADYQDVESVGVMISADSQRVWVCVNGECVLRVKSIKELEINDQREKGVKDG